MSLSVSGSGASAAGVEVDGRAARAYAPGSWFAVFGDRVSVLLPPTEKRRVAGLWELVDDGADFDAVLDALIATGLRDLPAFVLLDHAGDGTVKAVLRGAVHARVTTDGDEVVVDGGGASTWVERTLSGVTALALELDGPDGDPGTPDLLPIGGGLVRVGAVVAPAPEPAAEPASDLEAAAAPAAVFATAVPDQPAPEEPEPALQQPEQPEQPAPPVDLFAKRDSEPDPEAEPEAATAHDPFDGPDLPDLPAYPSPAPVPPSAPEAPGAPGLPGPDPLADDPQAATVGMPVAEPWEQDPSSEQPSQPSYDQSFEQGDDHDGMTRAGGYDPAEFARQPGIPGQPPAPPVVAVPVATLVFSSGDTVEVDRPVLVGRAPEARRFSSTDQPRLVTVPSPQQEISSTHLEVRPGTGADHGTAVVTDMGSTNGTVLVQPGLPPEDLQPGIAVQLLPGAVIDLGDGVTIQVVSA